MTDYNGLWRQVQVSPLWQYSQKHQKLVTGPNNGKHGLIKRTLEPFLGHCGYPWISAYSLSRASESTPSLSACRAMFSVVVIMFSRGAGFSIIEIAWSAFLDVSVWDSTVLTYWGMVTNQNVFLISGRSALRSIVGFSHPLFLRSLRRSVTTVLKWPRCRSSPQSWASSFNCIATR